MGAQRIAIVGADDPIGEALLEELAESAQAPGSIIPVSLDEAEGCVRYGDEDVPCQTPADVDWSAVGVAIIASRGPAASRLARDLLGRGCRVLAVHGLLPPMADTTLLTEVHDAPTTAIIRVLRPLLGGSGLRSLSGFIGLPVAARGRAGIDELARQSRALFALESAEPEAFPVQIAFNLLPQVGEIDQDGDSALESSLCRSLRAFWGDDLVTQFTAAWLPTFHGAVAALHGASELSLDREGIKARLAHVPGVLVMDMPEPGAAPTPVTDGVDSTDVVLGRLRLDAADGLHFSLWLTYDHARLEALQLRLGLEKLIESGLN
ncbi:MAG: Asd/ArgC dimerization domain-containing protein [Thiobacillaceae bacterium]